MVTSPLRRSAYRREVVRPAVGAAVVCGAVALVASHRLGIVGLLAPVLLVVVVFMLSRPLVAVGTLLALIVLCEGPTFGIPVTPDLYHYVYKGLTPVDILVVVAFASVALDLMRRRREPRLPPALVLPLTLVALAMISGMAVGHMHGMGIRDVVLAAHVVTYLIVLPLAIFNLDLSRPQLATLIRCGIALAAFKAVAGLIVMAAGLSIDIEAGTHLTYYEPTANWLILVTLIGIIAAVLNGTRLTLPLWLCLPLLLASLVLSYRRSFWIAAVLALLLVIALASIPRTRVILVVAALLVAVSVWAVGAVPFQSQTPLVTRVTSLSPSKLETNPEDRYRLDERANVVLAIRQNPFAGLGLDVPWSAWAQPLGVEHVNGRLYVHFAFLYWWMTLGILGAAAYVAVIVSALFLAWRTWRVNREPLFRYFGVASFCSVAGLAVIETTASFTGVDQRFTVLFAAQLGLLAVLASTGVTTPVVASTGVTTPVVASPGVVTSGQSRSEALWASHN